MITDVKIAGQGCSISQASTSMMSAAVKGKSVAEARTLTRAFKALMSIHESKIGGEADDVDAAADELAGVRLGDLEALQGVVKFPVRIKCATLAWNTLTQGLDEIDGLTSSRARNPVPFDAGATRAAHGVVRMSHPPRNASDRRT